MGISLRIPVSVRSKTSFAFSSSVLFSAPDADVETVSDGGSSFSVSPSECLKYVVATGVQFSLLTTALKGVDRVVGKGGLPTPLVGLLFAFLSLRSRVASVLDNSRPNREAMEGKATPADVKRPSWTPPGIAFPFIWLTITGLRGLSSALVYAEVGLLASAPLLDLVLHLCVGDTWNTITNIEKRLGVSASVVALVWASAWNAIVRYGQVSPAAGRILAPSGVWISVATVLTFTIWRINEPVQPLWPTSDDGKSAPWRFGNLGKLDATTIRGGK